jgi:hypothetical protein
LNAVDIDNPVMRHITVSRAIHAGGEDGHSMTGRREISAQGMDGIDGTAIAYGRIICGYDV